MEGMKSYEWFVNFDGPGNDQVVFADDEDEAKVLAQAARIKAGFPWRVIKGVQRGEPARIRKHINTLS